MSAEPLSRRRALQLVGLGTAGIVVGGAGWAARLGAPDAPGARLQPGPAGQAFTEPPVLTSRDGLLEVQLTAAPGVPLAGRATSAFGFNGTSPGPTLRVRPGDLLSIRLVNRLEQPTNLHTHGLHVSPQGNSDNPFLSIAPGQALDYAIRIPADHRTGTFWYHPHHHRHAADQVFAGLLGALLVDAAAGVPADRDRVVVVSDTTLDASGQVADVGPMQRIMGREGELVLVNGRLAPVIPAAAGTAEYWRVVNACTSRVLSLRLDGHRLTQVALDGSTLPAPATLDRIVLAPGNRADAIIRPARPGRYALIAEPYDRGGPGMGMMSDGFSAGPVTVATLNVDGFAGKAAALPATWGAPLAQASEPIVGRRRLQLAMGMGMMGMGGMAVTIDGRAFDAERVDQSVRLGTSEEWTITNSSSMDHPFHLHVWPVQVIETSTGAPPPGVVQDVVSVPAFGWVRLRIRFADFPGRSVYHCHTLDHEDLGMMGTIEVKP